ncbi:sperm acrosome membrane-associated protein 6 isoform X5 [Mustela erminea]|uniref:sperm acrosome membrane-associated protein 6 isoform X5 n=1 Tax=Mustela erminea TaxID=36723 RepID=UPI0013867214|nr:sperm acrosome membrane-associated protein 6 isoform X5 [Mustela erminea]
MALLAQDSAVPSALVALMVLRAPAWACLLCFTSYKERMRICQIFIGVQSPELQKCEEAFAAAFEGLLDTEINYDERSHLHDAFTQMTHSLQEMATARGSFKVAFPNAAEKMRKVIAQLKEVQACIPPCGLQEVARRFRCRGCYSTVCDLPLDCPVQDLTVTRGNEAKFSCTVNFELPKEEITYSWKFAGGVTGAPPRGETELQVSFREVLRWAPREADMIKPWRPSLGELLAKPEALTLSNQCLLAAVVALASAGTTLMVWMFFRWYFQGS